jgi:hypothetical protein
MDLVVSEMAFTSNPTPDLNTVKIAINEAN